MESLFALDWQRLFVPTQSLIETVVRGTIVYIFLFVVLRFFLKRQAGAIGISDLLVIVIIADAAQNAMGADYRSVTEGALLVLTIVFWDYLLDWLAYRFPTMERILRPKPLLLIRDGRLVRRNMAREKISDQELMSQLHHHGIENQAEVKEAYIEPDGRLSVIKRAPDDGPEKDEDDRRV